MINLSSLSALIRTIRHSTGIDGPAAPIARVASVAPVADDDAGAMTSTALRPSLWARTQRLPLEHSEAGVPPGDGRTRRVAGQPEPRTLAPTLGAQAAPAPRIPMAALQSSALDLTATARLLQAVLRGTGLKTPVAPTIVSDAPLVPDSRAPAADLARSLSGAVAESGLFYEAHLARALRREYPVAALSREPQALWPATAAAEGSITQSASPAALPEVASAMLARQLDLLDTRTVLWNGEVWPGQRATIAFEDASLCDEAANDSGAAVPAQSWRTRITLDLPSLGRVHVSLHLASGALDLEVEAASPETLERLASARHDLVVALGEAQVAIARLDVGMASKP